MGRSLRRSALGASLAASILLSISAATASPILFIELASEPLEPGDTAELAIFLDTGGLTFEGYAFGIDIHREGGGLAIAGSLLRTPADIPGFAADLFGPPVVDASQGVIRNLNQASLTTSLAPGIFLLETISLELLALPGTSFTVDLVLDQGDALGLDGGSCPGTLAGCTPVLESLTFTLVPEQDAAALVPLGLALLVRMRLRTGGGTGRAKNAYLTSRSVS
jgi:hypothetical protein